MRRSAALPFNLRRSEDVLGSAEMTTTTERVHGLLRLDGDLLGIQWRLTRKTQTLGSEIRIDEEMEPVREIVLPLRAIAGARVRRPWWLFGTGLQLVLTASDLQAFDELAGEGGLKLAHPAEVVLRVRRRDALAAEEFTAEVALALAEMSLTQPDHPEMLAPPPDPPQQ
jgi:hypothetical protein